MVGGDTPRQQTGKGAAINVAGSLRMQSYLLATRVADIRAQPAAQAPQPVAVGAAVVNGAPPDDGPSKARVPLRLEALARQVEAEGVKRLVIVSDEIGKYADLTILDRDLRARFLATVLDSLHRRALGRPAPAGSWIFHLLAVTQR
mgnify:CR=1 FL=1